MNWKALFPALAVSLLPFLKRAEVLSSGRKTLTCWLDLLEVRLQVPERSSAVPDDEIQHHLVCEHALRLSHRGHANARPLSAFTETPPKLQANKLIDEVTPGHLVECSV